MRQRRWIELLQEYDFDIKYRPGKDNVVADGLSRKSFLNAISIPNNPILDMIKEASLNDPEYQNLTRRIQNSRETKEISRPAKEYSLQGGFLYYEQRLCVPKDPTLKKAILFKAHDSPISGHPGYAKTLNAIRKSYFWPRMKGDILRYVKQCLSCQRIKAKRIKLPGQLKPLDIPQMKWECISMDFVTGLPTVAGYDSVYIVVAMLTKVAHLIPVKTTYTASDIIRVFIKEIFRLHGLPKTIVSDRDAKFTSKFWTSLFQAIGTQLCFCTAYHPQTDGQTERVNQVIEDILRAYCSQEPRKWIQYLPLVEYAYNSFDHRSIGMSPFKALYGQECIAPVNFSDPTIKVEALKQMLDEMEAQTKAICKDIQAAQDRQKHYADKDRSERTFKLGDRVINDQAYKLRLPPNLKVHDVFHVSLLKPYVPNPDQILDVEQIVVPAQGVFELQPDYILETRERKLRNRSIIEHLVKWKDFPEEDATWEDEITLQKDYPDLSLR
ncbi:hypothetical protein L7F22_029154 [Adiantum nelumboides]|nr:hypothetical protein [Adiantum nelumboides]